MNGDLRELYQELILDHGRNPRNQRTPDNANRSCHGHNPLCGDDITVSAALVEDRIADIGFEGQGCAISQAAASTMTEAVKGLTVAEAHALFTRFHELVTGKVSLSGEAVDAEALGKLVAFAGVSEFPMRVKCATLAWHTLEGALGGGDKVTTE